ncbi:hypothetical protein LOZ66_003127 [Ophidiomyces ophidiicola]|nr:hypothetical protein LOZ66_003127 [Ophidiomyces ophidiicola]
MASVPPDEIIPPSATTPDAMSGAIRADGSPKIKRHKRLLNRLQRMSSTSSLERLGRHRSSSSNSRRIGKGSMSCVSLSSTLSNGQCWESSSSSQLYGRSSRGATDPRNVDDEETNPARIIETELLPLNGVQQTSIPLPTEFRPPSRGSPLKSSLALAADIEKAHREENISEIPPEKQNIDHWTSLPPEIQLQILSWLTPKELAQSARVSKQWCSLCFDGQLWSNFDASTYYRDIPQDALVQLILNTGSFIKHLNLRGCVQMREAWLHSGEQITNACRNLASFNVRDTEIDKTTLTFFLVRNPGLFKINLSGLMAATNSEMGVIAKSCPLLKYLDISWCPRITSNSGLREVVKACGQLKELRIGELQIAKNDGLMQALFDTNNLETLSIANCPYLTDSTLKILVHGSDPEIDILTDRAIVPARKFKHLDFSGCTRISDAGIGFLTGYVPGLESLQLSFCTGLECTSIANLILSTPRLIRLELEELEALQNNALSTLSIAPCATTLQHLNVSYCENIGDPSMLQIVRNCSNLKSLDLDNTRVSDLALMELCSQMRKRGSGVQLPKCGLRLAVFDCGNVTWAGVREVLSTNTYVPRFAEAEAITSGSELDAESDVSSPSSSTSSLTVLQSPPPVQSPSKPDIYPNEIIQLKCFYGWQPTVDKHTKRVLAGHLGAAMRLERKWADCMIAHEEAELGGPGSRRRRRRARNAELLYNMEDDDEVGYGYGPAGLVSLGNRRRARSGGCVVM